MTDPVNRPEHYTYGKYECKDILQDILRDYAGYVAFCLGNVIKYVWRSHHKNGVEDLEKARWYLDQAIAELKKDQLS